MATQKFLDRISGRLTQFVAAIASAGSADAGKIVALNADGKIDETMLDSEGARMMVASEIIAAGAPVNAFDSGGGVMKIRNADATAAGKESTGYIKAAVAAAGSVRYYEGGVNSSCTGLTPGKWYYLGTAPGVMVSEASFPAGANVPQATGNVVQGLGKALSATELQWMPDPVPDSVILA